MESKKKPLKRIVRRKKKVLKRPKKSNINANVIKKLVASELNKRRGKKSEPSTNDLIKYDLVYLTS